MSQKEKSDKYSAILVQGWMAMFTIYIANLVMDMVRCNVMDQCSTWASHIGPGGLVVITIVMFIYAVMPLLIKLISSLWFRYVAVGITAFITLFYVAHELTHLVAGDKPFGIAHTLDITHHIVGVGMIVVATLWAKSAKKEEQPMQSGVSVPLQASSQAG
ncbi:MAG: hypothetical protein OEZ68_12575 [Gammaproteobacteria bacterium]|nr:hypothetical protein [Gammaproteobacteria bacterium]MDH5801631.1 hypothetical protein [Gammaproteobacteria bacterium]